MNTSSGPEPGDAIQAEALARFLEDWQVEHGALTPAELAKAEKNSAFALPARRPDPDQAGRSGLEPGRHRALLAPSVSVGA
jgi:hypothetical protein